jgi:hypothetical protein
MVGVLTEYVGRHDLDTVLFQEITTAELLNIPENDVYYNIGTHARDSCSGAKGHHAHRHQ